MRTLFGETGLLAAALPIGFLAAVFCLAVFNRIPPAWLTEYGETPDDRLWEVRLLARRWLPWRCLFFAAILLKFYLVSPLYLLAGGPAALCLVWIAVADWKYRIIPDPFVVLLAITALGFIPWQESVVGIPAGILACGGGLWLMGWLGSKIYAREVIGFGDVKLMAAVGAIAGLGGGLAILCVGLLANGCAMAIGLACGRLRPHDERPLGPWLAAATLLFLLFRNRFEQLIF